MVQTKTIGHEPITKQANKKTKKCFFFFKFRVVLGHSFYADTIFAENKAVIPIWLRRFSFMTVANGLFAVDSFFLIGGILTCYTFMKETAKLNGKISFGFVLKYYVHRLWRITPPYMLVVMFSGLLTPYLGVGPNYPTKNGLDPGCRKYWWLNFFYINNFNTDNEKRVIYKILRSL